MANRYPLIILSHRKLEFIENTLKSIRDNMTGVSRIILVDDSGDEEHRTQFTEAHSLVAVGDQNRGYLEAMRSVWEIARIVTDSQGADYAMLWEEDFLLTRPVDLHDLATIMNTDPTLAQINMQRQPVYKIEKRLGYLRSHQQRGYGLLPEKTGGLDWVSRDKPFTTNPGLIRREILDVEWPTREEADEVPGGAEPAMSLRLGRQGWHYGWYGKWDQRSVLHVGTKHKSGKGY